MHGLITTAKLNDVDPQAWLADVLARINDIPKPAGPNPPARTAALAMEGNLQADESHLTAALSGCLQIFAG